MSITQTTMTTKQIGAAGIYRELRRLRKRELLARTVLGQIATLPRQARARRLASGVLSVLEATDIF